MLYCSLLTVESHRCVGDIVAGGVKVSGPAGRVVRHVVPVAAKALHIRILALLLVTKDI